MITRYCVAHKPIHLSAHLYDEVIQTPTYPDYELLTAAVTPAALLPLLPQEGLIGICAYRKIVVASGRGYERITRDQSLRLSRHETEPRRGHEFLVPINPVDGNIREHYYHHHHKADWEDCMMIANFSPEERKELEGSTVLAEGGCQMGVYPAQLMREIFTKVDPIVREFVRQCGDRVLGYNPVQRRSAAFLTERLESHYVLKEIRRRYQGEIPPEVIGKLVIVLDKHEEWFSGTMP